MPRFSKLLLAFLVFGSVAMAQEPIDVAGSGAMVRNWIESERSYSAVSRDGGATWIPLPAPKGFLNWRGRRIDPIVGEPDVPSRLRSADTNRLYYVQFVTDVIDEYADVLRELGADALRYHPHESFVARLHPDGVDVVRELPFVRAVLRLEVGHKLDPSLQADLLRGNLPTQRYQLMLVDKHRDATALEARVRELGGIVDAPADGGVVVYATLTAAQLRAVAEDDTVLWIDAWSEPGTDMDNARIQGGADYVEAVAGIDGKGIRGHVNEAIHDEHPEFAARPPYRTTPIPYGPDDETAHGTNTAGEIFAQGLPGGVKGMLPFAQMIESDMVSTTRYAMIEETQDPAKVFQTVMFTQSWGGARTLAYTSTSALMDDIMFDFPRLFMTNAQGNSGGPTSRPEAWSKNVCGIGGFLHNDNADPSDDCWCFTGSTGPAQDGRVGISFSSYYDNIRTTDLSSGYTNTFGGASGSTPIVNGLGGAVIQMFTDGLFGYPGVPWQDRFAARPNLTTTRVLLTVGCRQVDFTGETSAKRLEQGWGMPNLQDLYDDRDELLVVDEEDVLTQGQQRDYWVWVKPGTGKFRASMHHLEDEAVPSAIPTRINSLDLSVTELATGVKYWGNDQNAMGILEGPVSAPGGVPNDIDIHENVFLENPNPGVYQVSVRADAVRADSHVETAAVDADFALAIRGIGGGRDRSGMTLDVSSAFFGNLDVSVQNVPGGWTHGVTMLSRDTARHASLGDVFGVEADGLSFTILTAAPSPGNVFAFTNAGAGQYPFTPFSFPPSVARSASGLTLDAVVILFDASGAIVDVSNMDRVTVQ